MTTSRRLFLQSAGAVALGRPELGYSAPGPHTRKWVTRAGWHEQAMRWLTMNLVQDDPGKYDPDFWLDYLRKAHVDAASWNSGGIIAFYPTQIPFHRRNEKIGNTDPLGYLIEGCRRMGLIVTARVDHHATYPEAAKAHPEWISTASDGSKQRHWATPELFLTCSLGPYNENFMTSVMAEIETMYGVDGFNHNRWAPQRMCYCQWCREHFRNASGRELPRKEDNSDPAWGPYLLWREDRMFELWDTWNAAIQKVNANAFVLPGIGGERSALNLAKVRSRAKTLYLDYQGRGGVTPPWMAGKKGKELRSILLEKPAGITFSVGIEDRNRWKDSVQSPAELQIWVSEGVANGLRPKMAKFSGYVWDHRWEPVVQDLYTWQWKHERYLRNTGFPNARVGMLFSQRTLRFQSAYAENDYGDAFSSGMYHALIEARIPFDIVHEDLLAESNLDRFKLLILPNIAALGERQCEQIRAFAARGGSILATFESSLYDEWGKRRIDFGLADVFGVSAAGDAQGPMKNSYLRLQHATRHPLLQGLEDAGRMINGVYRMPVKPTAQFASPPLTLVAPYPDLPMEEVYPRDKEEASEVWLRESGTSRVVYFPFDIDRTFWNVLAPDHGRLLANSVRWALNEPAPVTADGHGIVDVTMWRQKGSTTVHIVNLTNPMMMKGPFRNLFPIGEQVVRIRLDANSKPKRVHLLTADRRPEHEFADGLLTVRVPSVLLHEVIAVDL